jgi:hypothetical protein
MDDHDRMLYEWAKFLPMIQANFVDWQEAKQEQEAEAEASAEEYDDAGTDVERDEHRLHRPTE